jgi:hypothetical protein
MSSTLPKRNLGSVASLLAASLHQGNPDSNHRLWNIVSTRNRFCFVCFFITKKDGFKFSILNFPFICSNIPAAQVYGIYISQLIRYSRACGYYQDFLDRGMLLTRKLLNQGFFLVKLSSSLRIFYGRYLGRLLWNISVTKFAICFTSIHKQSKFILHNKYNLIAYNRMIVAENYF